MTSSPHSSLRSRRSFWVVSAVLAATVAISWGAWKGPAGNQEAWAHLQGSAEEKGVRLAWTLTQWPDGLQAFEVRRRTPARDGTPAGAWTPVAEGSILPGLSAQRNLAQIEPDPEVRSRLQDKQSKVLAAGSLNQAIGDEFVDLMREDSEGSLRMLGAIFSDDTDMAYLYGFACSDRKANSETVYEYGLFAVYSPRRDDGKPIAVFTPSKIPEGDPRLKVAGLRVDRVPGGRWVRFSYPEKSRKELSIRGFFVYRSKKGEAGTERLTQRGITSTVVKNESRLYDYLDRGADPEAEYEYSVAPMGGLGEEYPERTTAVSALKSAQPDLPAAAVTSVKKNAEGRTEITWTFPAASQSEITGFQILVAEYPGGELAPFPGIVPPEARQVIDPQPKRPDVGYVYRILAVKDAVVRSQSDLFFHLSLDTPTPPDPSGLKARSVLVRNEPTVHLTWDPKAAGDKITEGYHVYADHPVRGKVVHQAAVPLVRGNEVYFTLGIASGREYTFGIVAVGPGGGESRRIEAKAYVSGAYPPEVTELKATQEGEGPVVLTWEYEDIPELRGFRVYGGNDLLADEKTLGPTARQWRAENAEESSAPEFYVRAVSRRGRLSPFVQVDLAPSTAEDPDARPLPPADFAATRVEADGKHFLELTWKADPTVAEYRLSTDEKKVGIFSEPAKIETPTPGKYRLQVIDPKQSVRARLWARNAKGVDSIFMETLELGKDRTLPPAILPAHYRFLRDDDGTKILWTWDYPQVETLLGFRIYKDDGDTPIVDETTLGPDARSWETGALKRKTRHVFVLEAVGKNDERSERGPARTVVHFQR